jgi:hypothetical protein
MAIVEKCRKLVHELRLRESLMYSVAIAEWNGVGNEELPGAPRWFGEPFGEFGLWLTIPGDFEIDHCH